MSNNKGNKKELLVLGGIRIIPITTLHPIRSFGFYSIYKNINDKNMMKKQVLTIEQMKHLNELGVDTSIASMYWTFPVAPEHIARLTPVGEKGNLKSWEERGAGIGAFTLQDLLEILPPRLEKKYMFLLYKVAPDYICEYSYSDCDNTLNTAPVGTVLETVYEMLVWVIEQNYIQKKYLIK